MAAPKRLRLNIRLSPRLKAQLEDEAAKEHRSLNQEICIRLERSLREEWRRI